MNTWTRTSLAAWAWAGLAALTVLPSAAAAENPTPASSAAPAPQNVWRHYIVRSPSSGKIERFWVGHAPDLKSDGKYPVLYLLPGLNDDENAWKSAVDPHLGTCKIIVVCPAVGGATWYMNSPAQPWMRWGDFLTEELRAFVESHYPASGEKGQNGIAGISAGGHGTFYHAIRRPNQYGSVGVLSGAMELRGYSNAVGLDYWIGMRNREYAERSCIYLLSQYEGPLPFTIYLDVGDRDGALPQMEALRRALDLKRYTYKWFMGQGSHSWVYWNSRAAALLAWHADQFAANRRDGRYTDVPAIKAAELKILDALPDVTLSDTALARLRAAWPAASGTAIPLEGLPASGGPLSKSDATYKEVSLHAHLTAHGNDAGIYVYDLVLTAGTPLAREGSLAMAVHLRNGRDMRIVSVPPATLAMPAGKANRRAELRARLVVEVREPDVRRGGMAAAIQTFDAAGQPVGQPVLGKAPAGSAAVERWPIAPQAQADFVITLGGPAAIDLAAVYEARLSVEPSAP